MKVMNLMNTKKILRNTLIILAFLVGNFLLWRFFIVKYNGDTVRVRTFDLLNNQTGMEIDYNFNSGRVYQLTNYVCNEYDSVEEAEKSVTVHEKIFDREYPKTYGYIARVWREGKTVKSYEIFDLRLMSEKQIEEMGYKSYKEASRKEIMEGFKVLTKGNRAGLWVD